MRELIGRLPEVAILNSALQSKQPELIAVYGRRRIGKTFLVRSVYANHLLFEFSGIHKVPKKRQLKNFHLIVSKTKKSLPIPKDWIEAFHQFGQILDKYTSKKKKVIFIDEFPWLDTRKSYFLPAFENFWNSYVSKRNDLVVVICGSAASYMVKNIVLSKGGLHNRITQKIRLKSFNLSETEQLFKRKNLKLSRYDIAQLYMALGGVPYYLEQVKSGESVAQALDRLCFSSQGFLRTEFDNIFKSLFDLYDNHENIMRKLAMVRKGLTRNELLKKSKIKSGGTLSKTLFELEESGFIERYLPYQGAKNNALYRLSDEYVMFYLKYIEKNTIVAKGSVVWAKLSQKPSYKSWAGFSFETICLKHIQQIKEALKIAGIYSIHGSWRDKDKVQIDMLIDRDDNVINLCEMKFYNEPFTINKRYAAEIVKKENIFRQKTKTTKSIFITFITTYG